MKVRLSKKNIREWVQQNPGDTFGSMLLAFNASGAAARTARRWRAIFNAALHEAEEAGVSGPLIGGEIASPEQRRAKAQGNTFVFTSAQSNTLLHDAFFDALVQYCTSRKAELHISRFAYNKRGLGSANSKAGSSKRSDNDDTWYDPRIEPYASDESLEITSDLVWCGELNIIPTRVNPISGFQNYTRSASSILPHAKMFLQGIPTMKDEPAKMIYTTGAVTQRNYIQKAAGQKADFHHVFGALVVEVDDHGRWWARQINANDDGSFHDLNTRWTGDGPVFEDRTQAITHGDLHGAKMDPDIAEIVFGKGGVLDKLRPYEQFFHDTIDFMPRNHHNIKDPHFLHDMAMSGTDRVGEEFEQMGEFLMTTANREWCKSFVVVSNHDQAVEQWLRNPDGAKDPVNMEDWHYWNYYGARKRRSGHKFHAFSTWLSAQMARHLDPRKGEGPVWPTFLQEDDSYRILGKIEAAVHGHLGPNGARGTPRNIGTAGKVNSAHTHTAGIFEGVYTAGVYGKLDMGYNKGLSSWSHSLILTHTTGKRQILTIKHGKAWR